MNTISMKLLFVSLFVLMNYVHTSSLAKRGNEVFKLLKETKEKVKHGTQCLPPSKYFAGSCYTYMKVLPATSWDRAQNNCLSLPLTKDARLVVFDSITEYEFVEQELIGPKSGSESVSVYVGLRRVNGTWLWSNDVPLKETPIYRFWVDNNKDILAYDCGVLWLSQNSSVLMAAPCAEQAFRPYVCKHTIDYCYNNSGGCGKYGTCLNLPLLNTYKCQCRFLYAGDRCEKWSSQGLQAVIGAIIIVITLIVSYIINLDRSNDRWSFKKSTAEHYQAAANSIYVQSRPTSYMPRSPIDIDSDPMKPCLPPSPGFINTSTPNSKQPRWRYTSSESPPPLPPPIERKHRYSFRLSVQELEVTSHIRKLFIKPKRLILIILPILLTIIISIIIIHSRQYIKSTLLKSTFPNSTRLFEFCSLYDNHYYVNLITLPIVVVIIIIILINQNSSRYCRNRNEHNSKSSSIYIPIPLNPFSKVNRFDTMILCGIVSHEIFQIIEEIFLKATEMKFLTMRGPLFDLIRQIGLVFIIGMRYYPLYTVLEMNNANFLYYGLCAFYTWIDLIFRIIEQSYCVNVGPLIKAWHRLKQFKQEFSSKLATHTLFSTTMSMNSDYHDSKTTEGLRGHFQRYRERIPIKRLRQSTTTLLPALQINSHQLNPIESVNWSSIYLNLTSSVDRNESQSTFDQFNIDSAVIGVLKYAPYYLCLTYICIRLTYLCFEKISHLFPCWNNETDSSSKKFIKHIYHEPDLKSSQDLTVEYRYVRHLFQKTQRILIENKKKISFIKSLFYKIYRPNKYFHYSKQILNMYMIAFMLTYYLTFNILEGGFYIIEKVYSIFAIPLIVLSDELDLPTPNPSALKYEIIVTCLLTATIYYGQLLWGMKNYQRQMLDAYKGKFIDIPPRTAFQSARLISKHVHYSGYCIAYLGFGYITMGNVLFISIIIIRLVFKQLFLLEQLAKVVIPVLVIYLSKFILTWFLSRTFFLQRHGTTIALKNLRGFFVFCYFNFFFDCFLGIVSCALRVSKASAAALLFLPRLDYCIFGRALEKMDSGFISYVSFIHMECLHTHPVLIYFCSIMHENLVKRNRILKLPGRDSSRKDLENYKRSRRARMRWWLTVTLANNMQLIQLRKSRLTHLQLITAESFNEFLERTVWNRFHTATTMKFPLTKSQRTLQTDGSLDSNTIIRNQTTGCTTLLLDSDEHDDRRAGF